MRGSAALAKQTGIRPVIIAITVVAFGTSAPELVVSVNAAIHHTSDIAVGNIIGSVIANTGLIVGISALIKPIKIEFRLLKKEVPILIACELLFLVFVWNLELSRVDGAILCVGFILFNWYCIREAAKNIKDEKERVKREYDNYMPKRGGKQIANAVFIIVGLALLILGSHFTVKGAVNLAKIFNISQFVVAASVVALGTSLPELAASAVAAARSEFDISIGNVLGSNIFNVLICIGLASLITPLSVKQSVVRVDTLIMIGLSIVLGIFMRTRLKIGRLEGIILILIYGGYLAYLFSGGSNV